MNAERMEELVQRAVAETNAAFQRHGTYDRCECTLNFEKNSQLATDGMKVALVLSIISFYNAVTDKLPPKACRQAFEEFYDDLRRNIDKVGIITDRQNRERQIVEQMEEIICGSNEALRRMGFGPEQRKKYI